MWPTAVSKEAACSSTKNWIYQFLIKLLLQIWMFDDKIGFCLLSYDSYTKLFYIYDIDTTLQSTVTDKKKNG
jgi:hypothetical protein